MSEEQNFNGRPKPVALVILDGWGIGEKNKGNAIANADLPTFKELDAYYPHIALQASGISVGLPWGEAGNSEVGHMTLGSGKVIYQNMPRITMSIQNGEFFQNPIFIEAIQHAKKNDTAIHLMGLVGKGSVHSNIEHLYALLEMMKSYDMKKVFIHLFTDGRDSSPTSGLESVRDLSSRIERYGVGHIASIGGRYFAMDRNNNWDRVQKAYTTIVKGEGPTTENPEEYMKASYKKEIFDEFIEPAAVCKGGVPIGQITDGDSVIFFNYREDRARQITKAFATPDFSDFPVSKFNDLFFVTMTQYEENLPVHVAFPPIKVMMCLGKVLSENNLKQLRIAETEKFAHVTYFFNGGNEESFAGEDRVIIPSKDVANYNLFPRMSAPEITEQVLNFVEMEKYDFILINFANADMVGHTGVEEATIEATEAIDGCLAKIIAAITSKGGQLLITADHGNAEEMVNLHTGEKDTEHSANPVPLWYVTAENRRAEPLEDAPVEVAGLLSDVAPTVLDIMHLEKPDEITGESLLDVLK
ncbi:MAG: 2,3-bisphosphoglycerate-independent phosphoglycerate mutase [Parcubacteria group bacterium]